MPTLSAASGLFGHLSANSVFVAPADGCRALAALRALRIRAGEPFDTHVNAFGLCPAAHGVPATVFCLSAAAVHRLVGAGLIDRNRIVSVGR